jgi:deoxyribonuclease V
MMELALHHLHAWDVTPAEAVAIQRDLASLVRAVPLARPPRTIAGVDVSVQRRKAHDAEVQAAVVVLALPSLDVVASARWRGPAAFPYVPGLLSFREVPAVLRALEMLATLPDVIMADAHGLAHPRRMGMASHLGLLLDMPVFGVAKSKLVGDYAPPADEPGAQSPLYEGSEQIGVVLRTRVGIKPLFVSVGHRITLAETIALTLATHTRYRLPEPARRAHQYSREAFAGQPKIDD